MNPENVFPFVLGAIFFLIPLVMILTRHQQKMTMMLNGIEPNKGGVAQGNLTQEISELRQVVHEQTLMIDEMRKSQAEIKTALNQREDLTERVRAIN